MIIKLTDKTELKIDRTGAFTTYELYREDELIESNTDSLYELVFKLHEKDLLDLDYVEKRIRPVLNEIDLEQFKIIKKQEPFYEDIYKTFEETYCEFLEEMTESSVNSYRTTLKPFLYYYLDRDFEYRKNNLDDFTFEHVKEFILNRIKRNDTQVAVLRSVGVLRALCVENYIKIKKSDYKALREYVKEKLEDVEVLSEKELEEARAIVKAVKEKQLVEFYEREKNTSRSVKFYNAKETREILLQEIILLFSLEFLKPRIEIQNLTLTDVDFDKKMIHFSSESCYMSDYLTECLKFYVEFRKRYDFRNFKEKAYASLKEKRDVRKTDNSFVAYADFIDSEETDAFITKTFVALSYSNFKKRNFEQAEQEATTKERIFKFKNKRNEQRIIERQLEEEMLLFIEKNDYINNKIKEVYEAVDNLFVNSVCSNLKEQNVSNVLRDIYRLIKKKDTTNAQVIFNRSIKLLKDKRTKKVIKKAKKDKKI